jgi:hypothetical protein
MLVCVVGGSEGFFTKSSAHRRLTAGSWTGVVRALRRRSSISRRSRISASRSQRQWWSKSTAGGTTIMGMRIAGIIVFLLLYPYMYIFLCRLICQKQKIIWGFRKTYPNFCSEAEVPHEGACFCTVGTACASDSSGNDTQCWSWTNSCTPGEHSICITDVNIPSKFLATSSLDDEVVQRKPPPFTVDLSALYFFCRLECNAQMTVPVNKLIATGEIRISS